MGLLVFTVVALALGSGCSTTDPVEAEARRLEKIRQGDPVMYELERRQQLEGIKREHDRFY